MSSCNSDNESQKTTEESVPPPAVEPIRLPTIEEVRGQDIWNNCAVRSVVSGVMGLYPFYSRLYYFSIMFVFFCFWFTGFFLTNYNMAMLSRA